MEIENMNMQAVESRMNEVAELLKADDADVEALNAEVDTLIERKHAIEAEATAKRELREKVAGAVMPVIESVQENRHEMNNAEIRNTEAYINAYANYIKYGNEKEARSLLTENVNGTLPVPEFVYGIVAERLKASPILSRVRRMEAGGNVKVGFEYDAPAAEAHTEGGEAIAEEALLTGIVEIKAKTWKKFVEISDEALDTTSGRAFLEYIYDEIARGIIKARENAVVAAILAAPQTATKTTPAVAKTGTAMGNIADFVNARALLSSAAEDLVIICTPSQYAQYKGMQMAANYGVDPFDGLTVLFNDTATAPIIGDLYGVMEVLPKGNDVQFKYDDITNMTSDMVRILGRQPSGIAVVGNNFFAKVSA